MAIDPYALCPCGSGKKLKFCCSDLVGEIEKIHRMIEGDQPRAALRHVEQTLASHPGRASLLDLKVSLELVLGELQAARTTVDQFVAAHADSPTAHACQAMVLAEGVDVRAAVDALQRALALTDRAMPMRVFEALGAVGGALLEAGHVLAAQAHLWLHASLAPADDDRSREALIGLNHYSGLPLLLRDQRRFCPWPENVPWKDEAEQAARRATEGKWHQAVEIVDRLGQRYGADPTLVFNRALLGGCLADDRALVAGLHAYAQLDVPLDDAVEAEAVAQLIDPDLTETKLDTAKQAYSIRNFDALMVRLTSDKCIQSFEMDPAVFAQPDQPRPRHTCMLLDRPMPTSGVSLQREDVPRLVGFLAVYGRQTDRAERLELTVDRGPEYNTAINTLREIAGDALGELTGEIVIGTVSPTEQALNWRWHFPRDTPPDVRRRLVAEERRAAIVERWPEVSSPALGGKSPRQAAGDQQLRIALIAAVLILEQGSNSDRDAEAVAELRRNLGLDQPAPIEPAGQDASRLPLVRVPRMKMEAVSDADLVQLYRRASMVGAQAATVHIAREAVRRPALADRIPPRQAYARLIAAELDLDRALTLIGEARAKSRSAGESTAEWDLIELERHVISGNADQAKTILAQIEREHGDDPHVSAALYRLLYEMGLIPDELPMQAPAYEEMPAEAVGSAAEPAGSRIWTPDSDRPSAGKSSLWTPS